MEYRFFEEGLLGEMFWLQPLPLNQSAFAQYTNTPIDVGVESENPVAGGLNDRNMNKRMMQFLRRSCSSATQSTTIEMTEPEREIRCYRHMISERMRRKKQQQSYSALHSLLPIGTKGDKNTIIQMTGMKIQELQRFKEELWRRNVELEANLAAVEGKKLVGGTKIKLKVENPSSGIDSMVEVLQCLKNLGLKTTTIRSKYSAQEFSAELEIETDAIGAADVEKAVQRTLCEVERKRPLHFPEELMDYQHVTNTSSSNHYF